MHRRVNAHPSDPVATAWHAPTPEEALGTRPARRSSTITLPGAKSGLISAALVQFTLVVTDFGIPKVIGSNFNLPAARP